MQMVGGWEVGLLSLMAILYLGGALLNPDFFGTAGALQALLRDSARFGVMAVDPSNDDYDRMAETGFGVSRFASRISSTCGSRTARDFLRAFRSPSPKSTVALSFSK